jgi:predicted Fe-Mo cluster-binding NifX family protein
MKANTLKIAVPLEGRRVSAHFGHARRFCLVTVETSARGILTQEELTPPPHEPGVLPAWLAERGVSKVLTGGMGPRAIEGLSARGIEVLTGVPDLPAEEAVRLWLEGSLSSEQNCCDSWVMPWQSPDLPAGSGYRRTSGHGRCRHGQGRAEGASRGRE